MHRHKKKEKIKYQPIPAREILLEIKNLSELMIDLAYSAALFKDKDLAEDVVELEERVDTLAYLFNIKLMLAARDAEDAKILSGVAKIASAADKISDAAGDVANIVLQDIGVHPIIADIFERVEEKLAKIRIPENSSIAGMKICHLDPASMGIDIIAIHRGGDWIINPSGEETIKGNDIIVIRGVQNGINEFREKVGEKITRGEEEIIRKIIWEERFKDVIKRFIELKDLPELMIDLAYSALILNSRELAEEVQKLEEYVDRLHTEFELLVLSSGFVEREAKGILGLIRLGVAAEKISDAAAEIAEIILRGIEPHPLIKMTVENAEETVIYAQVSPDSILINKTIREVRIPEETGMWILAIKRGNKIIRPRPDTKIEVNDIIIAAGYSQGKEDLINLTSPKLKTQ
ncbi:MAG: TrkA C-terminal domain-containing protein [Candidatus Bathyarchaeia archaeon]